jgi:hypothetical protein
MRNGIDPDTISDNLFEHFDLGDVDEVMDRKIFASNHAPYISGGAVYLDDYETKFHCRWNSTF